MAGGSSRAGGRSFGGDGQRSRLMFQVAAISGQTGHLPTPNVGRSGRLPNRARPRSDASRPPGRIFVSAVYRRAQRQLPEPLGIPDLAKLPVIHQPIDDAIAARDRVRPRQGMTACFDGPRRSIGPAKPAWNSFLSLDDAGALEVVRQRLGSPVTETEQIANAVLPGSGGHGRRWGRKLTWRGPRARSPVPARCR